MIPENEIENYVRKLREWAAIKRQMEALKTEEIKLREALAERVLEGRTGGSKTAMVVPGLKVRAESPINYKVDQDELALYRDQLADHDWAAIKFKPECVVGGFKKLPVDALAHKIITASPGLVQFRIVEDIEG